MYLGVGLASELLRHVYPLRAVSHLLFVLEQTPARTLELCGLMEPLRQSYLSGGISSFVVRWVYGSTMVAIVFVTAVVMASLMAVVQGLWLLFSGPGRTREP
jgi:hypothetical protein